MTAGFGITYEGLGAACFDVLYIASPFECLGTANNVTSFGAARLGGGGCGFPVHHRIGLQCWLRLPEEPKS